ncbi:hypothetical protein C9J12_05610 [Photobacterium frigidiphilum]|uniref:Uncharacterized protein n=1 Tax=Photobacterium frigidiphilum TaxID=264736 RepID=A0A2T3JME9_9GAMM|nr:hypothetical protein C9J12_05610 [Photobacterium frigidiphilum]
MLLFYLTSNISCTAANSPSVLNFIPKLRSKTCQLHVFVRQIHQVKVTVPIIFSFGTNPQYLLSELLSRLSPKTK